MQAPREGDLGRMGTEGAPAAPRGVAPPGEWGVPRPPRPRLPVKEEGWVKGDTKVKVWVPLDGWDGVVGKAKGWGDDQGRGGPWQGTWGASAGEHCLEPAMLMMMMVMIRYDEDDGDDGDDDGDEGPIF